jgi:hypothetical protein
VYLLLKGLSIIRYCYSTHSFKTQANGQEKDVSAGWPPLY